MVWVKPREVLISPLWTVVRSNPWFVLQRRMGKGTGLLGSVVGTIDNVLSTNQIKFRILLQMHNSDIRCVTAIVLYVHRMHVHIQQLRKKHVCEHALTLWLSPRICYGR